MGRWVERVEHMFVALGYGVVGDMFVGGSWKLAMGRTEPKEASEE